MRTLAICCAALVLMGGTALAGDNMAVPKSTLESMGLVSMQPLSDDDGREVRGEGVQEQIGFVASPSALR